MFALAMIVVGALLRQTMGFQNALENLGIQMADFECKIAHNNDPLRVDFASNSDPS